LFLNNKIENFRRRKGEKMKKLIIICSAVMILTLSNAVQATNLDWAGTVSGYYHQNTTAYFNPNTIGTTISGTIDITNLGNGAVEMFGLIDKKLKDQSGYMWQSGAYIYIYKTANGVLVGTSDGNLGGEITTDATNVGATNIVDFVMNIEDNVITLTSTLFSGTKSRSYGDVKTLNNAYGYAWDEFAEGAYLGGCVWPSSTVSFDVTATNAVPEPATMALLGLGVFGLIRRKHA